MGEIDPLKKYSSYSLCVKRDHSSTYIETQVFEQKDIAVCIDSKGFSSSDQ